MINKLNILSFKANNEIIFGYITNFIRKWELREQKTP